jgi:hypothetical protein
MMIPPDVVALAEIMLDAAVVNRALMPAADPLLPMLMLYKPAHAIPGKPATGDTVLVPANDIVGDDRMFNFMRGVIAKVEPQAILFWSETWVVSEQDATAGLEPRNDPKRRDALVMMIQTPDDSVFWTREFVWKDGRPEFGEVRKGGSVREFGRIGDWYPPKRHTTQ